MKKYLKCISPDVILSIIWIALWYMPILRLASIFNILWVICFFFWLIIALTNPHIRRKNQKLLLLIISCISFIFIVAGHGGTSYLFNRYLELYQVPLTFIMYEYFRESRNPKGKIIIYSTIPMIIVTSIITIIALQDNPFIARSVDVRGGDTEILQNGIGGYEVIYGALILAIVFFYFTYHSKLSYLSKLILYSVVAIFSILVIQSNFFTATLLLVSGILATLIIRNRHSIPKFIFICGICIIGYKSIGIAVINLSESVLSTESRTYDRLNQIKASLQGTNKESDVDTRSDVNKITLNTIIKNPLTGAFFNENMSQKANGMKSIGQHSTVLDTFAIWGISFGILFVYTLLIPFKNLFKRSRTFSQRFFVILVAMCFFSCIISNNLSPSMGYATFFVFPFIFDKFQQKKNRYEN